MSTSQGWRACAASLMRTAVLACTSLAAMHSQAAFINNGSGLAGSHQTIDFESTTLAHNEMVSTQFQTLGVSFTNAFGNPDPREIYPNLSGNRIGNFEGGIGHHGALIMDFAAVLDSAAFALVSADGGTTTFQAFLNGVLVESQSLPTNTTSNFNFFGFTGIQFDRITLSVTSFDGALMIDNLQTTASATTAVPEPSSAAVVLAALGALALARRRRTHG